LQKKRQTPKAAADTCREGLMFALGADRKKVARAIAAA
jgi:hypothetical protein